jgi:hypothetical protein
MGMGDFSLSLGGVVRGLLSNTTKQSKAVAPALRPNHDRAKAGVMSERVCWRYDSIRKR